MESPLLAVVVPVVLPLGFVVVAGLAEQFVETDGGWRGRMVRTGWDISAFSFGVIAGIFSNAQVEAHYGAAGAIWAAIACILASFFAFVLILMLRRQNPYTGLKGICSVALGSGALAPPVYFHAHALGVSVLGLL